MIQKKHAPESQELDQMVRSTTEEEFPSHIHEVVSHNQLSVQSLVGWVTKFLEKPEPELWGKVNVLFDFLRPRIPSTISEPRIAVLTLRQNGVKELEVELHLRKAGYLVYQWGAIERVEEVVDKKKTTPPDMVVVTAAEGEGNELLNLIIQELKGERMEVVLYKPEEGLGVEIVTGIVEVQNLGELMERVVLQRQQVRQVARNEVIDYRADSQETNTQPDAGRSMVDK